jgi:hypothetical protein
MADLVITDIALNFTNRDFKNAYWRMLTSGHYIYKKFPTVDDSALFRSDAFPNPLNEYSLYGYLSFFVLRGGAPFYGQVNEINWAEQVFTSDVGFYYGVRLWLKPGVQGIMGDLKVINPWHITIPGLP